MTRQHTTISNCRFAYKCAKTWSALEETKHSDIKFCTDCQRDVFFCHDDGQLAEAIKLNHCVAFFRPSSDGSPCELGRPELAPLEEREDKIKELIEENENIQETLDEIYEHAHQPPDSILAGVDYKNIAPDGKRREEWYRLAAEHGHVKSQYKLGQIYEKGEGVIQSNAEAAKWYRKAAEHYHYLTDDTFDEDEDSCALDCS